MKLNKLRVGSRIRFQAKWHLESESAKGNRQKVNQLYHLTILFQREKPAM